MKKIVQYCCFVLLLNFYSNNANTQITNLGEIGIVTATQLAVTGDYNNNNSTIRIELGSATENNLLTATGNIVLNGTLKIDFANGYLPATSQTFTIITGNAITGSFNNVIFPTGVNGTIIYNTNSVVVTITNASISLSLTGASSVCAGSSITITPNVSGGVFSSITGYANVSQTGVVTGSSAGTATIKYTLGNKSTNKTIAVNALPSVPTITYAPGIVGNPQAGAPTGSFCVGRVFGVAGTPSGGAWSATGAASITSNGIVSINTIGAGSIKYNYTNANGCSNSRTMVGNGFTCASRGVSISNEQSFVNNDFAIYPNPAKSIFNVNVETLIGSGSIVIVDLYGKQVKQQSLSMGINIIDISNLCKGFYLVSVITAEGKSTKKLVVE